MSKDQFELVSPFQPTGDQPEAIDALVKSIEAGNRISLFIHANRVLRLVSISKRLLHSHNRLHNPVKLLRPESTDTKQIIPHLIVFKCKLLLIAHCLDLASSALPVKTAGRRYTKRRRCNHLL